MLTLSSSSALPQAPDGDAATLVDVDAAIPAGLGVRLLRLRLRTWEVLDDHHSHDRAERRVELCTLVLIGLNVAAVVLQSVRALELRFSHAFYAFEVFSVAAFALEYAARLWSCVEDARYRDPLRGRIRFATRPLVIVDLLAILPGAAVFASVDLRVLRAVRLFRLVRVLKAARYVAALDLLRRVLHSRRDELVVAGGLMAVLLVIASSLMYFAENAAQPEKFSSIPMSMWWAVATLTTVGYGDVYPVTDLGRVTASFISILGIGFFALPTAILGSGFAEAVRSRHQPARCPHCGEEIG